MRKNLYYKDLDVKEASYMEEILYKEIEFLNNDKLKKLLDEALFDYKIGLWAYDGPTFSKKYKNIWEVPAFIHDWRNSMGYVSYDIDDEMFSIMILLNYPINYITQRWVLTRFTFLNILIKYLSNKLNKSNPSNLFLL